MCPFCRPRKVTAVTFSTRATQPPWPVEEGRTRTVIAGYYVDWTGSVEPTEAEVLAVVSPDPTALLHANAKSLFLQTDPEGLSKRIVASILIDEINSLRAWITAFKAATAAATSLADFKTRVAALDAMPARTMAQAKTAYNNRADDGTVDS